MSTSIIPLVIAMLGTGGTLAALIIGLFAWLRVDMRRMEDRLTTRITSVENRITDVENSLTSNIKELRQETGELRERMAHLEGHLSGIREAIVARAAA